jgi:hypothetical protein
MPKNMNEHDTKSVHVRDYEDYGECNFAQDKDTMEDL